MKIYHVKNNYIFDSQDQNGTHRYAYDIDDRNKPYLVAISHLYEMPLEKKRKLRKGFLKKYKLKNAKLPVGISTERIYKDINGKPISLNSTNSKICRYISKKDQKNIKRISNTKYLKRKKMTSNK